MAGMAADRRLEAAARRWTGDTRAAAQLREHYAIERALAQRLREAPADKRGPLYAQVYGELFTRVPHHPQLRRRASEERSAQVDRELHFLAGLLTADLAVLEVGAGDLALSRRLAEMVGEVHAVDVASEIADGHAAAANLHIYLTDGPRLPLVDGSVVLAYSNQLIEHLHPHDALEHLREVFRVLAPGGRYLCVTPNALTGPWDISRMFSTSPAGLHLHEYSNRELAALLATVGFVEIRAVVPGRLAAREVPAWFFTTPELALQPLPVRVRRLLLAGPWRKPLNSIRLLAAKPAQRRTPR
jgi:SAM-dependent methyltransferase